MIIPELKIIKIITFTIIFPNFPFRFEVNNYVQLENNYTHTR
jgi:hypothetical protein